MASAVSLLLVADNFRSARTYTIYLDFRQKFSAWLLPFNIYGVTLVQSLAYIFHDTFQELDTISEDGSKTFHMSTENYASGWLPFWGYDNENKVSPLQGKCALTPFCHYFTPPLFWWFVIQDLKRN
jgi:hypothetical protein